MTKAMTKYTNKPPKTKLSSTDYNKATNKWCWGKIIHMNLLLKDLTLN